MELVRLDGVFDIKYGVNLELNAMTSTTSNDGIPFVSRTEKDNGVSAYVKPMEGITPNPENTLSVAGGGSILETFLQEKPYYSGRDLYYLRPKLALSKKEMLAYCTLIRANKYKYNYGRQANKTLKDIMIPHPDEVKQITQRMTIPEQPSKDFFITRKYF